MRCIWLQKGRHMSIQKWVRAVATLACAVALHSPSFAHPNQVIGQVIELYPSSAGTVVINLNVPNEDLNCTPVGEKGLTLRQGTNMFKELYATLLTALVAQRTVLVRISEGTADCNVVYLRIY